MNVNQADYLIPKEDYDELFSDYMELTLKNEKLQNNWNELKKWLETTKLKEFEKTYGKRYGKTFTQAEIVVFNMIKEKMQELESE